MYNKLFTKILDSSIWLQTSDTRVVWVTLLAAMDEDGFVAIATPANLARRANVSDDACERALVTLEAPEKETARDDDDGRRIERVPGGWIVIKAKEYQQMTTRQVVKNSSRERVKRWRERHRNVGGNAETLRNAGGNGVLRNQTQPQPQPQPQPQSSGKGSESTKPTPVEEPTVARQEPSDDVPKQPEAIVSSPPAVDPIDAIYQAYPRKVGPRKAKEAIERSVLRLMAGERGEKEPQRLVALRWLYAVVKEYAQTPAGNRGTLTPHPTTWFNQSRYLDDPAEWQRQEETHAAGTKAESNARNIAATRELIQDIRQARSDSPSPHNPLPGLPAASGTQQGNAGSIPGKPGDAHSGTVGSSVQQGATGTPFILPASGRTASTGRMPDRRPTF